MTATKKLRSATKTVKSTAKKLARKVDKKVVEPIADLFRSNGKSRKKLGWPSRRQPAELLLLGTGQRSVRGGRSA